MKPNDARKNSLPLLLGLSAGVFFALAFSERHQARAMECLNCVALKQNTFQAMSPQSGKLTQGWSAIESHLNRGASPVSIWKGEFSSPDSATESDLPPDHPNGEVGGFGARDFSSVFDPEFRTAYFKHGKVINSPLAPWNSYLPMYGASAWAHEANDYNRYVNALYAY